MPIGLYESWFNLHSQQCMKGPFSQINTGFALKKIISKIKYCFTYSLVIYISSFLDYTSYPCLIFLNILLVFSPLVDKYFYIVEILFPHFDLFHCVEIKNSTCYDIRKTKDKETNGEKQNF